MNKTKNNRRAFLQTSGALALGTVLFPQLACTNQNAAKEVVKEAVKEAVIKPSLDKFGIQLYTLRDIIPNDPKGVLKQVADMGFQQIEGYEGDQGLFWNMKNTEFKKYLDDLNIQMTSAHCRTGENFEEKAAQAAEIGMEYLINPYVGPQTSKDAWKKVTDHFNECGAICKKHGIKFAYHNHAYSFKAFSGMIPHEYIMDNTDPDTVEFEMDIYWVVTGGADPIKYLEKYPNRFRLCHVKDRMKDAGEERQASCDLGTGIIDFPKILKVAKDNGMKHFILEQERYDNSTPLKSAKVGAEYLKKMVFA